MKRIFAIVAATLWLLVPSWADNNPGRELSALLTSMLKQEEVHPDSIYPAIERLELRRQQVATPAARAVYSTVLAMLYDSRWKLAHHAGHDDYQERALRCYAEALGQPDALADVSTAGWVPVVSERRDSRYYGNDLLHVVWQEWRGSWLRHQKPDSIAMPSYADIIRCYERRGNREAMLLLTLDSMDTRGSVSNEGELMRLAEEYKDVQLTALVYLRLSQLYDLTPQQRRAWLEEGIKRYPRSDRKAELQNALTRLSDPYFHWDEPTAVYPGKTYTWHFRSRNIQSVTIDGLRHALPQGDPILEVEDSMRWMAPSKPGEYTITFVPQTKSKLQKPIKPMQQKILVSALQLVYREQSPGQIALQVVDSETGRPVPGVTLSFYSDMNAETPFRALQTDSRGRATIQKVNDRQSRSLCVRMSTEKEQHLPKQYVWARGYWQQASDDSTRLMRAFTDRAIYRPGQPLHVGGIVYRQLGWEAEAQADCEVTVTLFDAHRQEVETQTVRTDAFGVIAADFTLPADRQNGSWSVRLQNDATTWVSFQVDEYKRPSFTVELCDTAILRPTLAIVSGVARTVEGTPLRQARVTGTFQQTTQWWRGAVDTQMQRLDTIYTDHEGRFSYTLRREPEAHGVTLNVDVLSSYGEQQQAVHWYRTGETRPMPQPAVDSAFVFTCVSDTFDIDRPAHLRLSSNLRDIYLLYIVAAEGQTFTDSLIHFSDSTLDFRIPYRKEYGTGAVASFCFVKGERVYSISRQLSLAKPDRHLRVRWDTFRNLAEPGSTQQWQLTLLHPDGTPAPASLMLSLYDASLERFAQHAMQFDVQLPYRYYHTAHNALSRPAPGSIVFGNYAQPLRKTTPLLFSSFNENYTTNLRKGGMHLYGVIGNMTADMMEMKSAGNAPRYAMATAGAPMADMATKSMVAGITDDAVEEEVVADEDGGMGNALQPLAIAVPLRQNFQETALFRTDLRTDHDGRVALSFTLPDCVTTWRLLGVAHTQDMQTVNLQNELVARKSLQAQLRLPRFLRPGDEAFLTATIGNTTTQEIEGTATLQILDAESEKVLMQKQLSFDLDAQADTTLRFPYTATERDVIVRWVAEGNSAFSDGEQRLQPVLPALQEVTNTRVLTILEPDTVTESLTDLFPKNATQPQLVVEYTAHPEQYALNLLPRLAVAQGNDVLSLASAYYAGCLAKHLGVAIPDSTAFYLERIKALQQADGSFAWYPGMPGNTYLTREVGYLFRRLLMLLGKDSNDLKDLKDSKDPNDLTTILQKAARCLLLEIPVPKHPDTYLLRNLYVIEGAGLKYTKQEQHRLDSLVRLLRKIEPKQLDFEGQALAAIVMQQRGDTRRAKQFAGEFRRLIIQADAQPERGAFIEHPQGPFTSINRKLHIHVQLMEALQQVFPGDPLLPGMRRHLLYQKRTQAWETPMTSANAVFALMQAPPPTPPHDGRGVDSPAIDPKGDKIEILNKKKMLATLNVPNDSLGYVCDTLNITTFPTTLRIHHSGVTTPLPPRGGAGGEAWAAVHAHFLQPYTDVDAEGTGLKVSIHYPQQARVGDRIEVRYTIQADRDYEYVTLSVPRPATCEPADVLSAYRWADGLGFFREVHDSRTDYHICRLPRGHYTLTETLYIEQPGTYHTGLPILRCEYASEFQAHGADAIITCQE